MTHQDLNQEYIPDNSKKYKIVIAILVSVIVLGGAGIAFAWYSGSLGNRNLDKVAEEVIVVDYDDDKVVYSKDSDNDGLTDEEELIYGTDPNNPDTDEDGYSDKQEIDNGYDPLIKATAVDLGEYQIMVEWNDWPSKIYYRDILDPSKLEELIGSDEVFNGVYNGNIYNFLARWTIYKVGEVKEGLYSGNSIYIITILTEGPSFREEFYRVIHNEENDELIHLAKQSDELYDFKQRIFNSHPHLEIANLETVDEINIPNSDYVLYKGDVEPRYLSDSIDSSNKLFKYNDADYLYQRSTGCLVVKANDGSVREYYYGLDWLQADDEDTSYDLSYVPQFNYVNGEANTVEYRMNRRASCGGLNSCYSFVDYIENADQLEIIGSLENGEKIYALRDQTVSYELSSEYSSFVLDVAYDSYYPGYDPETNKPKGKKPIEAFMASNPLIYWQDPFGNFVEFIRAEYVPAAECGKPVIYLYPEQEMNVSVQVSPNGGFTKVEPAYNDGWYVKAKPDGELYNYDDKTVYPYLFWEGYAMDYERPEEGFLVRQREVETFLEDKLAVLGLVQHEYDEFIEFWLPRMQDFPYYYITFMPQADFDKLAPLDVSPRPDTIIRVFMDFQGLNRSVQVKEPILETPERLGFTVIEWGGALHE